MIDPSRRSFLKSSLLLGAASVIPAPLGRALGPELDPPPSSMKFGLVTYLWGKDWDLPTLIANCEKTKILGVELRTTHAHGVEPSLGKAQRGEVKKRFGDSPVALVGIGSNERFDHPDPARLAAAMKASRAFIKLSHEVGGSGVKVKPDSFHESVSHEKTIEQIGKSLNILGRFGADLGQEIRLEVHGGCSALPVIKKIMDAADHPNVGVCWNCNAEDLKGDGLEKNFRLVRRRFGATLHVRELNVGSYPYRQLMDLLVKTRYAGWVLLEARTSPADRIKALVEQRLIFEKMTVPARSDSGKPVR